MQRGSSVQEARMRFGAGIWLFGQFVDRYATDAYGPPVSTLEAIERAGEVGDIEVLDVNYPFTDGVTVDEVAGALSANRISAWCITPHIYTREFRAGAFTNPDPNVRASALALCEQAVGVAKALGAPTVKLWPGQDGYDFPLQADYREVWRLAVEGVSTVAAVDDDIRVAIEYKVKEPRIHISFSTAARTLVGIAQSGREDIGVVVDLGHSLFAKETPADALHLVNDHGKLFTVEVNDNWREWDDGLPVAVGTAIAARLDGSPRRTFVLCGDGELQEGSNWEAIMAAGHRGLDNLVAIVDRNGLQQGARTEDTNGLDPLDAKFAAFGWAVREIDGNDVDALLAAFAGVPFAPGRPSCIIARTVKGRGVSFIEDRVEWHHKVPTAEQVELA